MHTPIIKITKVKLSLCLNDYALRHEDVCGSGCMDPRNLDFGTSLEFSASRPGRLDVVETLPGLETQTPRPSSP
jgi:hypothetical protein